MRERVRDVERLRHILDAINGILESKSCYSFEDISKNSIVFYGFVKYLEIIGEAVYMLTKEYKSAHPEIDWVIIEKMRHVLVHGYYHILPGQLWTTLETDIPTMKPLIEHLYAEESLRESGNLEEPVAPYGIMPESVLLLELGIFDIIRRYPNCVNDAEIHF